MVRLEPEVDRDVVTPKVQSEGDETGQSSDDWKINGDDGALSWREDGVDRPKILSARLFKYFDVRCDRVTRLNFDLDLLDAFGALPDFRSHVEAKEIKPTRDAGPGLVLFWKPIPDSPIRMEFSRRAFGVDRRNEFIFVHRASIWTSQLERLPEDMDPTAGCTSVRRSSARSYLHSNRNDRRSDVNSKTFISTSRNTSTE